MVIEVFVKFRNAGPRFILLGINITYLLIDRPHKKLVLITIYKKINSVT